MITLLGAVAVMTMASADVSLIDGGICTGLAWIPVPAGAKASKTEGPDFDVIYVAGPGDASFGVYIGGYPSATPDPGKTLLNVEGLTIRPSHDGDNGKGQFEGYLIENKAYLKNHIFGKIFAGDDTDLPFFKRMLFGKSASAKCDKSHETSK